MRANLIKSIVLLFTLIFSFTLTGCPEAENSNGESEGTVWNQFVDSAMGDALGSIAGTVYINGRPEAFGTVQVLNEDGKQVASDRATQFGHYTIRGINQGTYRLVYLNARGAPVGEETVVRVRPGRLEQVDLLLDVEVGVE